MAACDNLYGNLSEWKELKKFIKKNKPEHLHYMNPKPIDAHEQVRICYIANIQGWLIETCPFEWIKTRLEDNFTIQRFICGKAHHHE